MKVINAWQTYQPTLKTVVSVTGSIMRLKLPVRLSLDGTVCSTNVSAVIGLINVPFVVGPHLEDSWRFLSATIGSERDNLILMTRAIMDVSSKPFSIPVNNTEINTSAMEFLSEQMRDCIKMAKN